MEASAPRIRIVSDYDTTVVEPNEPTSFIVQPEVSRDMVEVKSTAKVLIFHKFKSKQAWKGEVYLEFGPSQVKENDRDRTKTIEFTIDVIWQVSIDDLKGIHSLFCMKYRFFTYTLLRPWKFRNQVSN